MFQPNKRTCPACQGTKRTKDANGQFSCPWCFETGEVTSEVWAAYWSVRESIQIPFSKTFGARTANEGKGSGKPEPWELSLFKQKKF